VEEKRPGAGPDDQMVLQIVRMKYVAAVEMAKLLTPYMTEGANLAVIETAGVLLITERKSNLRKTQRSGSFRSID
jgi:type II secretory pathway component GspD/PulD (secretin)